MVRAIIFRSTRAVLTGPIVLGVMGYWPMILNALLVVSMYCRDSLSMFCMTLFFM